MSFKIKSDGPGLHRRSTNDSNVNLSKTCHFGDNLKSKTTVILTSISDLFIDWICKSGD